MFKDQSSKATLVENFADSGLSHLVDDINSEFYWDVFSTSKYLTNLGCNVSFNQTGKLSWVLVAQKA